MPPWPRGISTAGPAPEAAPLSGAPRRPLVPLAVTFFGGLVAGAWWPVPPALPALLAAGLAVGAGAALRRGGGRQAWAALAALFAALGLLHQGLARWAQPPHHIARLPEAVLAEPVVVDALVAGPPELLPPAGQRPGRRLRVILAVTALRGPEGWLPATGRARLTVYEPRGHLAYGDRLRGPVRLRRPRGYLNPGAFDPAPALRAQGIALEGWVATDAVLERLPAQGGFGPLRAVYALRERLGEAIDRAYPQPSAGLLKAMLLGDRSGIPEAVNESFLASGTYHVLAISGLNVSVLAGALFFLLRALRLPLRLRAAACLLVITGYAALAGGSASVVRAAVMADVLFLAILLDREADLPNTVAIAALGLALWNPAVIHDVGFLLTFAATIGIVVAVGPARRRGEQEAVDTALVRAARRGMRQPPGRPWAALRPAARKMAEAVAITLAATAATLPILAMYFNRLSPVGVVANVPIVPLSGAITAVGTAAGAFLAFLPGGLPPLNWATQVLLGWLTGLAEWFAAVPHASLRLYTPTLPMAACYYVGLGALAAWRRWRPARWVAAAAAMGLLALVALRLLPGDRPDAFRATVLDVGQGDGIVVELPGGRVMVVDAGGVWDDAFDVGERVVAPYLWWRWIGRIDILVITHPHPDHANGARALLRHFRVGEVWDAGTPSGLPAGQWMAEWIARQGIPRRPARAGSPARRYGDVEVEVLHPPAEGSPPASPRGPASDVNNNSVVLRLGVRGHRLLLAGDVEAEGEAALLRGSGAMEAEVLKVPHHGGRTSSTPEFLGRVRPKVAVISAGPRNRFRHPHPETLQRYAAMGARVFRTDRHGAVTIEVGAEGIVVRPFVGEPLAVPPGVAPGPPAGDGYPAGDPPGPDAEVAPPDLP